VFANYCFWSTIVPVVVTAELVVAVCGLMVNAVPETQYK
jgi:hypothetical protein